MVALFFRYVIIFTRRKEGETMKRIRRNKTKRDDVAEFLAKQAGLAARAASDPADRARASACVVALRDPARVAALLDGLLPQSSNQIPA